jgi:hypothetical protein
MQEQMTNLKDVTSNILADMFFLYEETEPDSYEKSFKYCAFITESNLKIKLYSGQELAVSLTKNFLGSDMVTEEDILDVLKEILNMIIGNYIGKFCIEYKKHIPVPQTVVLPETYKMPDMPHSLLFYDSLPLCIAMGDD